VSVAGLCLLSYDGVSEVGQSPWTLTRPKTVASVHFTITQDTKRRLRICGYSDQEIAQLTPQKAHAILARLGWQPDGGNH
jgi:N-acetyl-anhydromuramyl-L-alanine amidase AmpD